MYINKSKKYRIKKTKKIKKIYKIKIGAEIVAVTWKVYYAYKRPIWRESKRWKVRRNKEVSYELLRENGFDCENTLQESVDNTVVTRVLTEKLRHILPILNDEDRYLIEELYYNNRTERDMAKEMAMSKTTFHDRKKRLLQKLKNFF